MMNKSKNQEKNSESMHTDKIAEAIGLFSKVIEEGHKKEERSRKLSRKSTQITALISLFSVIATIFGHTLLTLHGESVQRRYEQAQEIQRQIDKKIEIKDQLNKAMINSRSARDIVRLSCKNGNYVGNQNELAKKRLVAGYALVEAGDQIPGVFNKRIWNTVLSFVTLVNAKENLCAGHAPSDIKLKLLQRKINGLILSSVAADIKKEKLLTKDD